MTTLSGRACALLLLTVTVLHAQVPQLINYQGRVAVGAVNFDGPGQFKFALVNAGGTTTYWSNDGTSNAGSQPLAAVTLTVTKGLFSVLLGDATLPNMTVVPATVFTNAEVYLRVWFNDGVHDSQRLTPDQRIAAVGYAMMAANVPDGMITGAKIAAGAVQSTHLAAGAVVANLNAASQSAVASGGLVLSATENAALVDAGYVRIGGTLTSADGWVQRVNATAPPAARYLHTAVWTGSEMIVWGGAAFMLNDGGRYNPTANSWTTISVAGAPAARQYHTAVWTGTEMIVWGGSAEIGLLNNGGRYNPASDKWTAVSTTGAPTPRSSHTAVWAGNEMIVWGGSNGGSPAGYPSDGGRYTPVDDTWTTLSTVGAPSARNFHTAVWTGSEMIIWGGFRAAPLSTYFNDGGRYHPAANSWTAVNQTGAPAARRWHTAVWTGSEMIVWGGFGGGSPPSYPNEGGRYTPANDSWAGVAIAVAPSTRSFHTAVWTGSEMLVWGGFNSLPATYLNDGGRYDPASNRWTAVTTIGAPAGRYSHTAVWAGTEMIVWGGTSDSGVFNDTFSYTPGRLLYLYQRP